MMQQFNNQLDRIHQNSLFNGASQYDTPQVQRIQQNTINPNAMGMNAGFGGGGFQQGVSNQALNRIHENSLYNGSSQQQANFPQAQRIQQNTIYGNEANPLAAGMNAGMNAQFGGAAQGFQNNAGFGGGFQQGVSQQQLDRIQQNSLFNGASQYDNAQVQRIQQNTVNPNSQMNAGMGMGMGMGAMNAAFGGGAAQGFQNNAFAGGAQGFQNNAFGGGARQAFQNNAAFGGGGFQQGVSQQEIDRIHQNSLFNGASQYDNAQVQRIQQNTVNPNSQMNAGMGAMNAAFGGGAAQGFQNSAFGGGAAQNFQNNAGFGGGFQQGVSQQQVDRIHQNSLFNGASQFDNAQVQRIQQNTINPNAQNALSAGFGASAAQGFQNNAAFGGGNAFRSVMNADMGMRDAEGPSAYPASMYTGRNMYDNVNQGAFNQVMNPQAAQAQF
ncbi:MAG TPA: hypothetical protein VFV52_00235 [Bacilli bacterium]|nr:hypothetical protein [Bacilli bacterium]